MQDKFYQNIDLHQMAPFFKHFLEIAYNAEVP